MPYFEFTITVPDQFKDPLVSALTGKGCLGVIDKDNFIIAYFPAVINADSIVSELTLLKAILEKQDENIELSFTFGLIQDQDWNESWKKGFTAIDVGNTFTILPPWEQPAPGRINLLIDPGMAFGTGHHETTRSCLVLMEKYLHAMSKESFLDVGAGTGILAIAASKLGFQRIMAVDTDPLATEAAHVNADLNRVSNMAIRSGSIDEADGTFDCITANIISSVLIQLAPEIASRLSSDGIAILAGILKEEADQVIVEIERAGLMLKERHADGKWVSFVVGSR